MPKFSTVGDLISSDIEQSSTRSKRYWKSSSLPVRERRKHRPRHCHYRRDRVLKKIINSEMKAMVNRLSKIEELKIMAELVDS